MDVCGIYCIENIVNGKKYIGQSQFCWRRIAVHKNNLRKRVGENVYFQRAWDKNGEDNFVSYILETCSIDELDEKEIYYVKELGSHCSETGYNISFGGGAPMRGRKHTDETKQLMSFKRKGQKRRPMSDEQKKKLSDGRKGSLHWSFGKKHSPETIAKMIKNNAHNKHFFTDDEKEEHGNLLREETIQERHQPNIKVLAFHKASGKWRARVLDHHKEMYLGLYLTDADAAKAYDEFCWKKYKKKEMLNFENT